MKSVFAKVALATFVGYPSLLAAEAIGLVPSVPISGEIVIGCYVAGGLLALVWHDYGRATNRVSNHAASRAASREQLRARPAPRPQPAAGPARHHPVVTWGHQTISA